MPQVTATTRVSPCSVFQVIETFLPVEYFILIDKDRW